MAGFPLDRDKIIVTWAVRGINENRLYWSEVLSLEWCHPGFFCPENGGAATGAGVREERGRSVL
jgi:hypothetical protein